MNEARARADPLRSRFGGALLADAEASAKNDVSWFGVLSAKRSGDNYSRVAMKQPIGAATPTRAPVTAAFTHGGPPANWPAATATKLATAAPAMQRTT